MRRGSRLRRALARSRLGSGSRGGGVLACGRGRLIGKVLADPTSDGRLDRGGGRHDELSLVLEPGQDHLGGDLLASGVELLRELVNAWFSHFSPVRLPTPDQGGRQLRQLIAGYSSGAHRLPTRLLSRSLSRHCVQAARACSHHPHPGCPGRRSARTREPRPAAHWCAARARRRACVRQAPGTRDPGGSTRLAQAQPPGGRHEAGRRR